MDVDGGDLIPVGVIGIEFDIPLGRGAVGDAGDALRGKDMSALASTCCWLKAGTLKPPAERGTLL